MWPSCRKRAGSVQQSLLSRICAPGLVIQVCAAGFVQQALYRSAAGFVVQDLSCRVGAAGCVLQGLSSRICPAGILQLLPRGPCPALAAAVLLMLPLHSGSHCTCSGGSDFPVVRGLGKLPRVLLALLRNVSVSECFSVFWEQTELGASSLCL